MSFHEGLDDHGTYYRVHKVEGTIPILFIHGVGLDHSIWTPQTEFFKNQTTIVYDLIGHGLSTCTLNEISFDDFSNQIDELLKILRIQKIIVIGFSLGGLIAAHFSSTRKHRVEKNILFGLVILEKVVMRLDINFYFSSFLYKLSKDKIQLQLNLPRFD